MHTVMIVMIAMIAQILQVLNASKDRCWRASDLFEQHDHDALKNPTHVRDIYGRCIDTWITFIGQIC